MSFWIHLFGILSVLYLTSSTRATPISQNDIPTTKVVESGEATPHEFPWQVSLQWKEGHYCAGVIIATNAVLTTASCATITTQLDTILGGMHELDTTVGNSTSTQQIRIGRITSNSAYPGGPRGLSDDIAVINTVLPIDITDAVRPITYETSQNESYAGMMGTICGWGTQREELLGLSEVLMKAIVPILTDEDCEAAYGEDYDSKMMICAGDLEQGGVDFCTGDTGGPLMIQNADGSYHLIGISSWGTGCGKPGFPGVYTKVSYFTDFIKQYVL